MVAPALRLRSAFQPCAGFRAARIAVKEVGQRETVVETQDVGFVDEPFDAPLRQVRGAVEVVRGTVVTGMPSTTVTSSSGRNDRWKRRAGRARRLVGNVTWIGPLNPFSRPQSSADER